MITTQYLEQPKPVRVQRMGDFFDITVAVNVRTVGEGDDIKWEADTNTFTARVGEIDLADLNANPANYLGYIPTADRESIKTARTQAIQEWMDATAQAHGYDSIFTAASYATSTNAKFKAEAEACIAWRDRVWEAANQLAADVMAGTAVLPDVSTMLQQLPQIEWPTV